ncbi:MAG: aminoacetone oxidase family FAD-binding enzyme [Lachnospiraceae bacterium]|nr:aminoacetone oxidase family FAD-binding enzyme [Lachnospiraceae bacterium]
MKIAVVGGGASGLIAAISAANNGAEVTVLEKNDRIGKKILVTGNGKCNLSNTAFSASHYYTKDSNYMMSRFSEFGVEDTISFFSSIGLLLTDRDGYLYPRCEQASAVLDVLRFTLERLHVRMETSCEVISVTKSDDQFTVRTNRSEERYDRVIVSCGNIAGLNAPKGKRLQPNAFLSLFPSFHFKTAPFTPALTALRCSDSYCKALAGMRAKGMLSYYDGDGIKSDKGEVQFTDYGVSGIPAFQLSRQIGYRLMNESSVPLFFDFFPDLSDSEWEESIKKRYHTLGELSLDQFFTGLVNKKMIPVLLKESGLKGQVQTVSISVPRVLEAAALLKRFPFTCTSLNPYQNAQLCAGGVLLSELNEQFEAKSVKGLYMTGEILDVDGMCGGYNLQWAWTSGFLAGRSASC